MVLTLAPEGTRANVSKWKTGFYYIATGAGVPISLGYLDYKRKAGGFGPTFYPTGDIDRDLGEIRSFYTGISGRHVGQFQAH
jgi:1-acyl-sn-glycerol-3-phosphate acyltransferase